MTPPKPYRHPEGYVYYQTSTTVDGIRIRPTVHEHQLIFLAHEKCDDPNCDCGCHPDCDLDCDFACPYKIFSNGEWQIHHGREGGRLPPCPKKFANYEDNLVLMSDSDHAKLTNGAKSLGEPDPA